MKDFNKLIIKILLFIGDTIFALLVLLFFSLVIGMFIEIFQLIFIKTFEIYSILMLLVGSLIPLGILLLLYFFFRNIRLGKKIESAKLELPKNSLPMPWSAIVIPIVLFVSLCLYFAYKNGVTWSNNLWGEPVKHIMDLIIGAAIIDFYIWLIRKNREVANKQDDNDV